MGKYILSIDQGTQSTKISVFDFEGNELCSAKHPLQAMVTAPEHRGDHAGADGKIHW